MQAENVTVYTVSTKEKKGNEQGILLIILSVMSVHTTNTQVTLGVSGTICIGESWRDLRNLGGISYFGLDSVSEVDDLLTNGGGLEEPLETLKQTIVH